MSMCLRRRPVGCLRVDGTAVAVPVEQHRGLRAVRDAELAIHAAEMELDCVDGHAQVACDLSVRHPARRHLEHLPLTRGKASEPSRRLVMFDCYDADRRAESFPSLRAIGTDHVAPATDRMSRSRQIRI